MDGTVEGGKGGAGVGVVLAVVYIHLKIRNVSPGGPNQAMVGGC